MRTLKDAFDNEVNLGDTLIYSTRKGSGMYVRYAVVYGINLVYGRYQLKVKAYRKPYSFQHESKGFYKTTLTANNFVKVPVETIPEKIRTQLFARITNG
jgi:hypothetical protein